MIRRVNDGMASIQIRRRLRPECQADMAIAATSSGHHHHTKWAIRYCVSMKRCAKSAASSVPSATQPDGCRVLRPYALGFVSDTAPTDMARDTSGWIPPVASSHRPRARACPVAAVGLGGVISDTRTIEVCRGHRRAAGVDDPTYPGVSVVDMGMIRLGRGRGRAGRGRVDHHVQRLSRPRRHCRRHRRGGRRDRRCRRRGSAAQRPVLGHLKAQRARSRRHGSRVHSIGGPARQAHRMPSLRHRGAGRAVSLRPGPVPGRAPLRSLR